MWRAALVLIYNSSETRDQEGTRGPETRRPGGHQETRDQEGTRGPETRRPGGHQETRDQETRRAPGDQRPGDQEGTRRPEPRDQHLPPLYTLVTTLSPWLWSFASMAAE
ncbi:unnamed protein product [Arctogadus glacialis]